MDRTDVLQTATLWFVVMTYLQTSSGSGPATLLVDLLALALVFLLPLYALGVAVVDRVE
jgi:hypothetical protein